jgi:uncharacterized lipoprotein YddW (UPF0748 family)
MLSLLWERARQRKLPVLGVLLLVSMVLAAGLPPLPASPGTSSGVAQAQEQPLEQMRAFWVPAHEAGFHNHVQVDELVNNVVRANANTIIAQMRRHGDSWYNNSLEPRARQRTLAPPEEFDPLAYLIARAHQHGIRVHAWLVVSVTCRPYDALYGHPEHVCTAHGPEAEGAERWTTATSNGTQVGDLDFGHPGSIIHFESVVQHLIRNYPEVDGVHLDFIRYGDQAYGYNSVSLDRFRQYYGFPASYYPSPKAPEWSQWRRDRVTEMVRRVYLRTKAIDPQIEVSVAAITWGGLGTYHPGDWPNSAAYSRVFQDWRAWLEEGIIDFAVPMQYFEEGVPRSRNWYNGWLTFGRNNMGRRAIVPGTGAWLNTDQQGISQIQRALTPDEQGRAFPGVALYAYNQPLAGSSFERRRQFMDQLRETVFSTPAQPPNWRWVYYHDKGHLQGIAAVNGQLVRDHRVALVRDGQWLYDIPTSYDGWYGAVDLEPGTYSIGIRHPETGQEVWHNVTVQAGQVTNGP